MDRNSAQSAAEGREQRGQGGTPGATFGTPQAPAPTYTQGNFCHKWRGLYVTYSPHREEVNTITKTIRPQQKSY